MTLRIIISHMNTDFDALASMVAAKKLYPDAHLVISDKQTVLVRQFLTIYRDTLDLTFDKHIPWDEVTELILVDVANIRRTTDYADQLKLDQLKITVYDHHPPHEQDVNSDHRVVEEVGATVTLLIEEIQKRKLTISPFEATLFGLGIYTDTGSFTYSHTTTRDFQAASYLLEQGMNLDIVQRFSEEVLLPDQQQLLNELFQQVTTHEIDGLKIVVAACEQDEFVKGLNIITHKLMDITAADAVLSIVKMKKHISLVGRASSERITLLPLLKKFKGGGHEQAGSANIKQGELADVLQAVTDHLDLILKPAMTARDMMTSPVRTIAPETTIEETGELMYRYGHSGFPVVENGKLVGMITRRDLEKANHHGLGHAPVKAYMTTKVITITPDTTEEEIHQLIIHHNIGRLPVIENGELVGIVSRTNIIDMLHRSRQEADANAQEIILVENVKEKMQQRLPRDVYHLLTQISKVAKEAQVSVYLIGGIVRDIFLHVPNDDVDIVVEGDGISFAKRLQQQYGGDVTVHDSFGTATWHHPAGIDIDVATSRLEYYDHPAALPDVETSTLQEDLYRRDFTINAMAIQLDEDHFGKLIDPFHGQLDLKEKRMKILHNLSFVEDPTRILRGIRFEIRFGFAMDEQTEALARHSMERVIELSATRMIHEMERLFAEVDPVKVLDRLFELTFWQQFGVSDEARSASIKHAKAFLSLLDKCDQMQPRWFHYVMMPFYHTGILEKVKRFALTKLDASLLEDLLKLSPFEKWDALNTLGDCHRELKGYSAEAIIWLLPQCQDVNTTLIIDYLQQRKSMPSLLTGADLIKQGLKPGPIFSEILFDLEIAILNQEVQHKEDALQWLEKQLESRAYKHIN